MKLSFVILWLCFANFALIAQYTMEPLGTQPRGDFVYEQERAFNIQLQTDGITFGYMVGEIETWYKTSYKFINVGSIKHPKEVTQNVSFPGASLLSESAKSFIYGKQNSLYVVRAGWGSKRYYSERGKHKSIIVGTHYEFGPTLGFLKPYYLKITRFNDNTPQPNAPAERYTPENAEDFLDPALIFGRAPFKNGLSEIKLRPGINAKFGMHFNWGQYNHTIKALEIGVMGDLFLSSVPLMVIEDNRPYFVNLYLNLQFGKRR